MQLAAISPASVWARRLKWYWEGAHSASSCVSFSREKTFSNSPASMLKKVVSRFTWDIYPITAGASAASPLRMRNTCFFP